MRGRSGIGFCGWGALLVGTGIGCATEIHTLSPSTMVAYDDIITVKGKHMKDEISVVIGGGPVPHTPLRITTKKDRLGQFKFRMPFASTDGQPLPKGKIPITVRVGSTQQVFEVDLTDTSVAPPVPGVKQTESAGNVVVPQLIVNLHKARRPIRAKLTPILPHGPPRLLGDGSLRRGLEEDPMLIDLNASSKLAIPLPLNTLENSSWQLQIQNSVRYGGQWNDAAIVVFIRE